MPILTAPQKATLAARLGQPDAAGLAAAAAAALLNAPSAGASPGLVAAPYAISDILGLLDAPTLGAFKEVAYLPRIVDDINAQNSAGVALWAGQLLAAGLLAQAQHDGIVALVASTRAAPAVPGPSWAASAFPGVAFAQPDGTSVTDQVTPAMVTEARS